MTFSAVRGPLAEHTSPQKLIKVEHDGRIIGYFLPAPPGWDPNDEETKLAFARLHEAVRQVREESGFDEDELVHELTSWKS